MATFNKFEDIVAWQRARGLCKLIKHLTEKQEFEKGYMLAHEAGKLTGGLITHLKTSELKGKSISNKNL